MEITEKLGKQITETAYLTKENTKRYRPILRFFYEQNQKMNFMLYKEEVYNELKGKQFFENYTIEQCDTDLQALIEWKNLTAIQDTSTVHTLEEFKNKKYRYQLTDFSVEIEKLVITLENLHIEGASLEPTLIERIKNEVKEIEKMSKQTPTQVNGWWENLNADFKRLNDNYQGYIKSFYNIKMEEVAQTSQFIVRKNDLILYLKEFIKSLQDNTYEIEGILQNLSKETENEILEKVYQAQQKIVRIDQEEIPEQEYRERNTGKWENFKRWFLGDEQRESEVININEKTSEIIRKITRIANQIAESKGNVNTRKAEYKKIAEMFCKTQTIEEAHKLSSLVFGITNTRHLKGNFERKTDSISSKISEEEPEKIEIKPRIREYKEKAERVAIQDKSVEKQEQLKIYLQKREEERKAVEKYIKEGKIEIENLPEGIEPMVRKIILNWISKANQSKIKQTKIEDGRTVVLHFPETQKTCEMKCKDGTLKMPAFVLEFKE